MITIHTYNMYVYIVFNINEDYKNKSKMFKKPRQNS